MLGSVWEKWGKGIIKLFSNYFEVAMRIQNVGKLWECQMALLGAPEGQKSWVDQPMNGSFLNNLPNLSGKNGGM